ncbi:MAG: hypothetical protein QOD51_1246 [Candidatus Eremiobacteraeota bacterium]|nr:hypothetical protein [Candidatus Eremiobacteraeota bacterium]
MVRDHAVAPGVHDALWAVLWNRRYDDLDEPVWTPESSFTGILAYARVLDDETTLAAIDTGESLLAMHATGEPPAVGSRVRLVPGARDRWRIADVTPLGLGIELRFDDPNAAADTGWVATLRDAVRRLRTLLDARRDRLAGRRAQLGALNEPPSLEEVWREELSAISDRVAMETEYTPQEHASLARARAKGARTADEEERKVVAARKRRFAERGNAEIAKFRDGAWPAIRDKAAAELRKYVDYRTEVVRLEDALQRIRTMSARANNVSTALDRIEREAFRARGLQLDVARLDEAEYAEELLRTVELLHAAVPQRAQSGASSFSAYRAPTAGPSVIPPRL